MHIHQSRRADGEAPNDVVFVLGAGVDRVFGLPLLNTLFHDLGEFARGAGKGINAAIRRHAKPLPLDLQTYGGDQAENLGQKLLGSDPDLLRRIISALDKHRDAANPRVSTVRTLMKKLSVIANENELNETIMAELSRLVGQTDAGVTDTLLDPNHIAFRPKAREAIKAVFTEAVTEIPDLTPEERAAFVEIIALLSNFEELMADLFTGYFTQHVPDQRKYFYLAWLLWACIRHKEEAARSKRDLSFYKTLSDIGVSGENVVTFNYTDFFDDRTRPRNGYFHGDCKAFIRFRTREYVVNDVELKNATTLERMESFISGLQVDWKAEPPLVSLPAIVPPLAMKPIICTEYLDRWYECGQTIRRAKTIVIAGYSFSVVDEHFNDLIRKGNRDSKLIVVDPSLEDVVRRVCRIVDQNPTELDSATIAGLECQRAGRLTFVKARAEGVNGTQLRELLRG
jgi:hypothetical protein